MRDRVATAVLVLMLGVSSGASAVDERGAAVAADIAAFNMQSRTDLSFGAAFEYRFTEIIGLEIGATVVPTIKSAFPADPVTIQDGLASTGTLQIFPGPSYSNPGGRAVLFVNSVRVHIPTTAARIEPYFVAGGGIAMVRRTADLTFPIGFATTPIGLTATISPIAAPIPIPIPIPPIRIVTQRVTSSTTDLALTLGGGLGVRVARQVSIDADLRLFRLLGNQDQNVGRFGVAVRYRF
jgi:opacity protein-like surface antigen